MSKLRKVLLGCSYLAFFSVCFVFFAYLTFPYQRLARYLETQIRVGTGVQVTIGELSPSWLTGVKASNVHIVKKSTNPDAPPMEATVERLAARISLLSLLSGEHDVTFEGGLGGGTFDGEVELTDTARRFVIALHEINIGDAITTELGVDGVLEGTVDATIATEAEDTLGSVDLTIAGLQIGPGKLRADAPMLRNGFTIQETRAGDFHLRLTVANGSGRLDELAATGGDLTLEGTGNIRPRIPLSQTHVALNLQVGITDAYREREPKLELLEGSPSLARAKNEDGSYGFRLTGTVSSPHVGLSHGARH